MARAKCLTPMRIAMISTPFLSVPPRDYGGTELIVSELVEGMMEQGHDVTLFATCDSKTCARLNYLYSTPKWPPHPLTELNHVSWAMARIAENRFDLIHAHSPSVLALARLVPDIPMVYTIHHERGEEYTDYYRYFSETGFICISYNQKRLEAPLPCCEVIHHGLSPQRYEWTKTPEDYVCFLGRFSLVKGPHTAIDVARLARLPIFLAGEIHPDSEQFAEQELNPRLRQSHVRNLGCLGLSEKVPLLRDARALLAPIEWEEPFGLVMIEAMLSGCPVVAFSRGSVPELIEEGVTGFIVNSPEEMAETIRRGGVLESFDKLRCHTKARDYFNRDRMVADHLRLYERIIAERSVGKTDAQSNPTMIVT